jgi:hypothetical protein
MTPFEQLADYMLSFNTFLCKAQYGESILNADPRRLLDLAGGYMKLAGKDVKSEIVMGAGKTGLDCHLVIQNGSGPLASRVAQVSPVRMASQDFHSELVEAIIMHLIGLGSVVKRDMSFFPESLSGNVMDCHCDPKYMQQKLAPYAELAAIPTIQIFSDSEMDFVCEDLKIRPGLR